MTTRTKGSKKLNRAWLHDHLNDPYVRLAQRDGYRSRAAYKLREIDETLGLVKPGQLVVDLGSAPGAWSQYLRNRLAPRPTVPGAIAPGTSAVGTVAAGRAEAGGAGASGAAVSPHGSIIALDLLPMEPIEGVTFLQGDFREPAVIQQLADRMQGRLADLVVSDMAPNLSGVATADAARVAHLVELAVEFAQRHLQPRGALVVKLFHGSGYSQLVKLFKETFVQVKPIKPRASRGRSAETFLVGLGLKRAGQ